MNMKKRIATLSVLAGVGAVTFLFVKSQGLKTPSEKVEAQLRKAFPGDSRSVFEQSEEFTVYSIHSRPGPNQKGTFHGYPIVGQTEIEDKKCGLI